MQRGLLLDVVVRKGTTVLKLFAGEDQALLVRGNALLILNFVLHVINRIRRLDFQCDRLPSQGLHKDLHATTQTKDEVKSRFLLNVVVRQSTTILKLLSCKDQTLLIRRDT